MENELRNAPFDSEGKCAMQIFIQVELIWYIGTTSLQESETFFCNHKLIAFINLHRK